MGILIDMNERDENINKITDYLDSLDHDAAMAELNTLKTKHQKKLFNLSPTGMRMSDMVPKDLPPGQSIIFDGHNTLPKLFHSFQKIFERSSDGKIIAGYNNNKNWLSKLAGPGYFVFERDNRRPEDPGLNYAKVPDEKPDDWPEIQPNDKGLPKLVYGRMIDYMRQVSKDVFIGEVTQEGKKLGYYFVLCRQKKLN